LDALIATLTALGACAVLLEGIRTARRQAEQMAAVKECLRHAEEDVRALRTRQDVLTSWVIDIERRLPGTQAPLAPPTPPAV
jgi:hypothetical protein